jgi:type II secretory pathway pseudopilin PulG
MKYSQKGFSAVEALLVLLVIGLIGGAGWYVWQKQNDKSTPNNSNEVSTVKQVELTDSSKTFSIQYPNSWSAVPYEAPGHDGPARPEPDWSKTPQPITLRNQNNKNAEIKIDGYANVSTTIDKEIEAIDKDQFNTYSKVTINGYEAIKHVLDFAGPSDAEKYKDITYTVLGNNSKVTLKFRERYSNVTTNGEYDFDATNLSSDFEKVVNSVKFLD